jgi:hypothetical protein
MSGFQSIVNPQPAPAMAGAFASGNPRGSMLAGDSTLVVGALPVTIGNFAWALNATGAVTSACPGPLARYGFVHRDQMAVFTAWLAQSGYVVQPGQEITLFDSGDFWAAFAAGAAIGQKVYANYADGTCISLATASAPTNALITATTAVSTLLTVTANTGAPIAVGQPVSGTNIPAGAYIAALGTGTGGVGTYTLSVAGTGAGSVTVTATTALETRFYVDSTAAAGELAKISSRG